MFCDTSVVYLALFAGHALWSLLQINGGRGGMGKALVNNI
jgi:hypothetical protein